MDHPVLILIALFVLAYFMASPWWPWKGTQL